MSSDPLSVRMISIRVPAITFLITAFLFGMAQSALAETTKSEPDRDLLLINGKVKTPWGWAEALAIENGFIAAVGSTQEIMSMGGAMRTTVDLAGKTVLPGLHDMHVHPLFAGLEQSACGFAPGAPPDAIAAAVTICVSESQPGEWIQGGNWVGAVFEPGQQNNAFLDAVAPDNPVALVDEAHHSVWLNSRALELAGINRDTPDPEGGIIERDVNGEPNGLLRETAADLLYQVVPQPTEDQQRHALKLASDIMLSFGITSYMIASVGEAEIATIASLSGKGVIKQRIRGCLNWSHTPAELRQANEALIAQRSSYRQPRFAPDCIKLFVDGVPTESQTAAMLEPYIESPRAVAEGRPEKGMFMIPADVLRTAVQDFDRQGLHIKFHVVGDAAVRLAIDSVEAARQANGWGGPRHHVGHNSFVDMADIPRVRDLQMAWEFSPYIWYPTPIVSADVMAAVGEERMRRFTPIKDALDTGALVVVGSDWSVVPSVNPWLALETMVTREKPGGSAESLDGQERVTLDEGFRILTENGARLMGHRDRTGTIEVGMSADVIVTETNPFEIPITEVHKTRVLMTFIEGEKVYQAED